MQPPAQQPADQQSAATLPPYSKNPAIPLPPTPPDGPLIPSPLPSNTVTTPQGRAVQAEVISSVTDQARPWPPRPFFQPDSRGLDPGPRRAVSLGSVTQSTVLLSSAASRMPRPLAAESAPTPTTKKINTRQYPSREDQARRRPSTPRSPRHPPHPPPWPILPLHLPLHLLLPLPLPLPMPLHPSLHLLLL